MENEPFERNLPIVSKELPLTLIEADINQAFYMDTAGIYWHMNIQKKEWREMNSMDRHPMNLQLTIPLPITTSFFTTIEDAVIHVQKLYLEYKAQSAVETYNYFKKEYGEEYSSTVLFKNCINEYSELVILVDRCEQTTDTVLKIELMKTIEEKLIILNAPVNKN